MTNLTLDQAQKIVAAALAKSTEIGSASSVAVLDSGRELLAYARQDGAMLASVEISQNKAYTAVSMKSETADLGPAAQPGAAFYGIQQATSRPFITFGGGVPIVVDGEVIGAIGVAGGSADQDVEVAKAGAAAN
ncbi:GlcG/HbpS family heme-binding protein [Rhodococcoides fascians]|uniref:GlcG/HbpS family heme-binding protein n=1 Tax=Rhodococcoides fascians TaxID=1828 RepID=UPI00050CF6C1|nr:heme-binding protein [Rhodococcus fascians]